MLSETSWGQERSARGLHSLDSNAWFTVEPQGLHELTGRMHKADPSNISLRNIHPVSISEGNRQFYCHLRALSKGLEAGNVSIGDSSSCPSGRNPGLIGGFCGFEKE